MEISKQELLKEALETGFRPEIMEKVWHLMAILDGISIHPFLKERLVLKGGTALNLFFFDLPRLSVDIDLNYIGQLDRQEMLLERPEVEKALEAIFQREGLSIRRIPEKHAGGKWQLRYASALGGNGNLEVDLNYMFRMSLYGIDRFQKTLAELEPKLLKIDEMFVAGDLEKDSYQRMKASYRDEIQRLQGLISQLTSTDSNFMKYCRYGMSLLGNLDFHYQQSSPHVRKKLLGSIFTGKLVFEDGKYRTTGLNEAVALIGLFQKELENKKAERLDISDKTFGNVPMTGLEPALYC